MRNKNYPTQEETLAFIKSEKLNRERTREFWFTPKHEFRTHTFETEKKAWLWVSVLAGHLGLYSCLVKTNDSYIVVNTDCMGNILSPHVLENRFIEKFLYTQMFIAR
jgi:hypothetical protein